MNRFLGWRLALTGLVILAAIYAAGSLLTSWEQFAVGVAIAVAAFAAQVVLTWLEG